MKNERLLEAIGEISDEYIVQADPAVKGKRTRAWVRRCALAACFVLVVAAVVHIVSTKTKELPMIEVTEDSFGPMGYEGYMVHDISEIVSSNPWTETKEISTLPVYKNVLVYDENERVPNADLNEMRKLLLDVAERLGLDADTLEITDNAPDEKQQAKTREKLAVLDETVPEWYFSPTAVIARGDGIEIEVDGQMTATITFEPALSLLDEYRFTHDATYEQTAAVAEYLKGQYKDLIGMDDPQINIYGGDYRFTPEDMETYDTEYVQGYNIRFFEGGKDSAGQIVNYNFFGVEFYCDDDGKLYMARVFQPDLSEKTGDYTIITADEAKELLRNGYFITTVMEEIPGVEYIAKTELIYRTGGREQYFMPYYCFYVELPAEEREDGMKTFGAYYVPAVKGEYIANMPVWDGDSGIGR